MKSREDVFTGTQFLLKIRSYDEDQMVGTIYAPNLDRVLSFNNTSQMLFQIRDLLASHGQPEADRETIFRAASQENGYETVKGDKPWLMEKRRLLAVFALDILFKEQGGWQGILRHLGTRREAAFRNIMELLLMLHDELVYHSGPESVWDETER